TAAQQNRRVDGAKGDVQMLAAGDESCQIGGAIHRVANKHATKKHDLREQEGPHAKVGRLILLRQIVKLMRLRSLLRQGGALLSQRGPPPLACRRHTAVALLLALPQSYR